MEKQDQMKRQDQRRKDDCAVGDRSSGSGRTSSVDEAAAWQGEGGLQRSQRGVVLGWVLVAAWAVVIFCMSANTGDNLDHGTGIVALVSQWLKDLQAQWLGSDVDVVNPIAHFCEYTVFGALLTNAWRSHLPLKQAVVAAVACASLYGVTDEFHQYFVPGRACDPADWLVDTCGGALGATLAFRGFLRAKNGGVAMKKSAPGQG